MEEGKSVFYDALPPSVDENFLFRLLRAWCDVSLRVPHSPSREMASVVVKKTSCRMSNDTLILVLLRFGS